MPAVIDLETDTLEPINQIAKRRIGKRLSPATLWRWCLKGIKSRGGRNVRLEAVKVSGCWCTTDAAFSAFLAAQNDVASFDEAQPRERDAATTRRLRAAGLLPSDAEGERS